MFQRILVPLDGSAGAERAIPVAASLARKTQGSLILLHIAAPTTGKKERVGSPAEAVQRIPSNGQDVSSAEKNHRSIRTGTIEQIMADAASYLALIPGRYADDLADLPVEMDSAFGSASPLLPMTARLEHVDLIVLCCHREMGMGRWGLESLTQQMMRHSPVPLLILNEHAKNLPVLDNTQPLRILVPLDGSLFSEAALEPALQLLSNHVGTGPREMCLLHVVDPLAKDQYQTETAQSPTGQTQQNADRYLQAIAERLRKRVKEGENTRITCLVTGHVDVASAILKQLEQPQDTQSATFSLLVLATHGREGIPHLTTGSITERLFNATSTPLLTVCPRETKSSQIHFALPAGGRN